jgi:hypothetical protein
MILLAAAQNRPPSLEEVQAAGVVVGAGGPFIDAPWLAAGERIDASTGERVYSAAFLNDESEVLHLV